MTKYNSKNLPVVESWAAKDLKTELYFIGLPQNGNRLELYERFLGFLLLKEELGHNKADSKSNETDNSDGDEGVSSIENKSVNEVQKNSAAKQSKDKVSWVQCDDCQKWRALPSSINSNSLAENWSCKMNEWDKKHNRCDDVEESGADEEEEPDDSDNEEDNELDDAYKAAVLAKYKRILQENETKKRKSAEDKADKQKKKRENDLLKDQRELDEFVAKLTPEEIKEGRLAARKRNGKGQIPIHKYPELYDDVKATRLLRRDIYFGADVNAQDKNDRTPLHAAFMFGKRKYRDVLQQHGAEEMCDISDRIPSEYFMPREPPKKKNALASYIDSII
jgi:hypothetical protein